MVFSGGGDPGGWSERGYEGLARAGFMQNPVVYRSVRLIASLILPRSSRSTSLSPLLSGSFDAIWWPMIGVLCLSAFLMVTSKPPKVRALTLAPPN